MGNVVFLLDSDGDGIERYIYDAFGHPAVTDWNGDNPRTWSAYGNRFMFTGREYFPELGLYDYRARFYYPAIGRFLQSDPTGFDAGDANLFRYCGGDPVNGSDPFGLHDLGDEAETAAWNFAAFGMATTEGVTVTGHSILDDARWQLWTTLPSRDSYSSLLRDEQFRLDGDAGNRSNVDSSLTGTAKRVLDYFAPQLGGKEMAGTVTSKGKVILGPEDGRTIKSSRLPSITSDTIILWHFHLLNVPGAGNPYIFSGPLPFGDSKTLDAYPNIPQFVGVLDGPPGQFTIFAYLDPEHPYVIVRPNPGHTPGF